MSIRLTIFAAVVALILATRGAAAQNALGDGTALDSNLNTEGPRNVAGSGHVYGVRNLLVTGNVAAGRGFRAAVGYRASDEFRGKTGSDDLYQFRAESALSALDAVTLGRGPMSINIGQDLGIVAYHRAMTGSTLSTIRMGVPLEAPVQYGHLLDAEARLDRALVDYQTNGRLLETESRPQSLAYFSSEDGAVMQLSASALRGLRVGAVSEDPSRVGLTEFDRARLLDQALQSGELTVLPGSPFELDVWRLLDLQEAANEGTPAEPPAGAPAAVPGLGVPTAYQEMIRSIAEQSGGDTPADAARRLQEQMLQTSQWLRGGETIPPAETEDEPAEETDADPGAPAVPALPAIPGPIQPAAPGAPIAGAPLQGPRDPVKLPDNTTLEMLRHGKTIDSLAGDDEGRFTEILRQGEQHLRSGDYFLAERQFVRALNFHPNHPLALAGLGNTQLGAGVLASASVTLRSLFVNRPEMIDVQYGEGILPSRERLDDAIEDLEERLQGERRTSGGALVVAYIGRQTGDRAMMERGIGLMEEIDPADPLIPVLKTIWLGGRGEAEADK